MRKMSFMLVILFLSLSLIFINASYSKTEPEFKVIKAEVVAVHHHPEKADTITVKIKGDYPWEKERQESVTIDPKYCKFYKDDKQPKTIDIIKPGDIINITYVISEGVMVAFNVVVLPESRDVKE